MSDHLKRILASLHNIEEDIGELAEKVNGGLRFSQLYFTEHTFHLRNVEIKPLLSRSKVEKITLKLFLSYIYIHTESGIDNQLEVEFKRSLPRAEHRHFITNCFQALFFLMTLMTLCLYYITNCKFVLAS